MEQVHAFYNPLADNAAHASKAEEEEHWIVIRGGLQYYSKPSTSAPFSERPAPPVGSDIVGKKEGEWMREKSSGLYLPYFNEEKRRNFKHRNMYLMERAGVQRTNSGSSIDEGELIKRCSSGESKISRVSSSDIGARERSTSWVETAQSGVERPPEVWVCTAPAGVMFYSDMDYAAVVDNKECPAKSEVHAIRESKNWLAVVEEESNTWWDYFQSFGRRSLRSPLRPVHRSGVYLPIYSENGTRLFKHEKMAALETIESRS
mmetsp:Transcript_16956/g.36495  ORF Transcript_16956/g.36495 Transcript_16956/m.36495 type:complete len:261 (+) Transcript_16956:224-1006(+)